MLTRRQILALLGLAPAAPELAQAAVRRIQKEPVLIRPAADAPFRNLDKEGWKKGVSIWPPVPGTPPGILWWDPYILQAARRSGKTKAVFQELTGLDLDEIIEVEMSMNETVCETNPRYEFRLKRVADDQSPDPHPPAPHQHPDPDRALNRPESRQRGKE